MSVRAAWAGDAGRLPETAAAAAPTAPARSTVRRDSADIDSPFSGQGGESDVSGASTMSYENHFGKMSG
ncbi:hypothetical protein Cme02nite_63710 [Catellatospora methionotrophica]|uniref:Uncharacterized protein n=1 Tax=Catellatospora methionotrophica TaxID=121620 RepID=A0A8J3LM13_9ACTN|nr:hypothetical protein Cme02nite_63710 [Catellatospora methionotrophica]